MGCVPWWNRDVISGVVEDAGDMCDEVLWSTIYIFVNEGLQHGRAHERYGDINLDTENEVEGGEKLNSWFIKCSARIVEVDGSSRQEAGDLYVGIL